eukprot:CAMPEP_0177669978 /NCGR_PEP_ID=MMETSP0447-20121125/23810_1 /TAXON_ID=0 /ORGANISM="Stygamoeba regulata, Strain BSH-02190019" /LENGTH=34 /DNA_ID= /DNA_START= /DNA_END= /DNA_ORIENTATION=
MRLVSVRVRGRQMEAGRGVSTWTTESNGAPSVPL